MTERILRHLGLPAEVRQRGPRGRRHSRVATGLVTGPDLPVLIDTPGRGRASRAPGPAPGPAGGLRSARGGDPSTTGSARKSARCGGRTPANPPGEGLLTDVPLTIDPFIPTIVRGTDDAPVTVKDSDDWTAVIGVGH